ESLGLVNAIVEPGKALAGALTLAEKICDNAPLAVRASLAIFNTEVNGDESQIWKLSDETHARLIETEDFKEGWSAFFERRPPKWTAR
ncbi:MAG: enoyl-CoA hydratase, partial [Dehalococcoidia bacterium]